MSQIEGAFVQGLGLYTLEELKYSPEGVLYTRGPHQYKIASVTDIPEEFHVSLLTPTPNPKAIYSSKVSIYGQAPYKRLAKEGGLRNDDAAGWWST